MSDKELVLELCKRLNLREVKPGKDYVYRNEYTIVPKNFHSYYENETVILGEGEGYASFQISFEFDESGKLISHNIYE